MLRAYGVTSEVPQCGCSKPVTNSAFRNVGKPAPIPDRAEAERIAATLPEIRDENLRNALARLGAAIKQP